MKNYISDILEAASEALPWERLEGKNILVTGATGLIGGCLVEVLMARGGNFHVYAAGRNEERARSRFIDYEDNVRFHFLHYDVSQHVEGVIYQEQTDYIAELLEAYKNTKGVNHRKPLINDYMGISKRKSDKSAHSKRHESDYYLKDPNTGMHYLIELKIGGDLDNKKARSEKEALLEQYCILANSLGSEKNIRICFATAYNRYGEGKPWKQGRVLQFFAEEELLISRNFWNLVCKSSNGYEIVIDEYKKNAHLIIEALAKIKAAYLPNEI